jgi:5-methylcytosine-specific restriction enzyme subunit McrC
VSATLAGQALPDQKELTDLAELSEYYRGPVRLDQEDAGFVRNCLKFDVSGPWADDLYHIEVRSHVCRALLPSSKRLVRVQPKMPIRNVLEMLGVAYGLYMKKHGDSFNDLAEVEYETAPDIFETLVRHFLDKTEIKLRRGLISDYVWREEDLTTIRGRISFDLHIRHNLIGQGRISCRFSEFLRDIPENQVLLWTLFVLSRVDFWTEDTKHRIFAAIRRFHGVSLIAHRKGEFPDFHYHRLNDDYRDLHAWARLFLNMTAFSDNVGEIRFRGFVLDMNDLFEKYISQAFLENHGQFEVKDQREGPLFQERNEPIRPDLTILLNGRPVAVVDAKYKKTKEEEFKNFDVYQMIAYATALGVDSAFLVYPQGSDSNDAWQAKVRGSPIEVSVQTVKLAEEGVALRQQARTLVEKVLQQLQNKRSPDLIRSG